MRVLLITHGLPPESVGGVEQHVDGLARALGRAGHDVHVYAKTGRPGPAQCTAIEEAEPDTPYRVTRFVYRYEGLDGLRSLYAVPALDDALRAFLAQHTFDVAHVHHLTGVSTGALSVLRGAGIPTALTLHDYWLLCPRGQMWNREGKVTTEVTPAGCAACLRPNFGRWIPGDQEGVAVMQDLHQLARETLAAPDMLIAPSARAIPPFVPFGVDPTRVRVVENGVDTTALLGLPLPDFGADRPLRIGYLGTLIPSKGLDVLVRAFQELPTGRAELRIHGNAVPYHGDSGFLTRAFQGLTPDDRVSYFGPYRTGDLPGILAGIDILVAPALWHEAFGLTVREALAAGRPTVVTRIGGLQDALTDGVHGRVVAPGDAEALAAALHELTSDRDRLRSMAAACRADAPVRGFGEMALDMAALYAELVEGHGAAETRNPPGQHTPPPREAEAGAPSSLAQSALERRPEAP
jgi:glycosyltransferase involved in cell wall biosynthesis